MYVCVCVCVCECDSSRQSVFWSSVFILPSPPCPPPHHVLPGDCENQYVGHWRRLSLVVVVRGILYPLWCRKRQTPFMHNLVLCCRQPLSSSPGCVLEPLHHYTTRLSGKFLRVYRLPLQPVPLSWVVFLVCVSCFADASAFVVVSLRCCALYCCCSWFNLCHCHHETLIRSWAGMSRSSWTILFLLIFSHILPFTVLVLVFRRRIDGPLRPGRRRRPSRRVLGPSSSSSSPAKDPGSSSPQDIAEGAVLPRLSLDSYSSTPGEGDSFFSLEDSCDSPSSGDLSSRDRHAHSSDLASQAPPSTVFREGMVTRQQRSDSDSSTGSGFGAGHPQWEVGNTFSIRQDMIWDEGNRSDSERPLVWSLPCSFSDARTVSLFQFRRHPSCTFLSLSVFLLFLFLVVGENSVGRGFKISSLDRDHRSGVPVVCAVPTLAAPR